MNKPKVEITKKVEYINDVAKPVTWDIQVLQWRFADITNKDSGQYSMKFAPSMYGVTTDELLALRDALNNLKI